MPFFTRLSSLGFRHEPTVSNMTTTIGCEQVREPGSLFEGSLVPSPSKSHNAVCLRLISHNHVCSARGPLWGVRYTCPMYLLGVEQQHERQRCCIRHVHQSFDWPISW